MKRILRFINDVLYAFDIFGILKLEDSSISDMKREWQKEDEKRDRQWREAHKLQKQYYSLLDETIALEKSNPAKAEELKEKAEKAKFMFLSAFDSLDRQ